jgi:N-acetylglutamate synthase-like GNAT family acetyltransferase
LSQIVPIPKVSVSVREARLDDVPFIDRLQKMHGDRVGFMATSWLDAKIAKGEIIVAEDAGGERVGYCMGVDKYSGREDCGIIHQLNVVPGKQRGFVGATLLKAMFDRAAYGCKLFCCWCAQDIEANRFWESMGFVPLAYRAGSTKKGRVHIFWQTRIRDGDRETQWWFPAKTGKGAMGEDRLVLPIPPGKHWSDEMPVLRPAQTAAQEEPALTDQRAAKPRGAKKLTPPPATLAAALNPRQFDGPPAVARSVPPVPTTVEKPKQGGREKKPKVKADLKLVAAARELRDRWMEHVNSGATSIESAGKYDVTRALPAASTVELPEPTPLKALPHAA